MNGPRRATASPAALDDSVATFGGLVRAVTEVVVTGRSEIDRAWVRTYHEVGRLINTHVLQQRRAAYGQNVCARLGEKTGLSTRTLHECAQFHRCFPIVRISAQLGWSHYVLLCQVADPATRQKLLRQAETGAWKTEELEARVRALNAAIDVETRAEPGANGALPPPAKLLTPKRGTPGLHRIVDRGEGRLAVDLGFKLCRPLTAPETKRLAAGDIVRIDADASLQREKQATTADLFTYPASVRRVVDGDTLVISLEVAPGLWLDEKLRLRGLDCPELATPEGKAARRFVEGLLGESCAVVVCTTKPDKYDRYLADVFALPSAAGPTTPPVFINNALLEQGHASRKDAWEFGDWGE